MMSPFATHEHATYCYDAISTRTELYHEKGLGAMCLLKCTSMVFQSPPSFIFCLMFILLYRLASFINIMTSLTLFVLCSSIEIIIKKTSNASDHSVKESSFSFSPLFNARSVMFSYLNVNFIVLFRQVVRIR